MRTRRKFYLVYFVCFIIVILFNNFFLEETYPYKQTQKEHLTFEIEGCNCSRTLTKFSLNTSINYSNTTCGREAYYRGPNQHIASYTFYGKKSSATHVIRGFFEGRIKHIRMISVIEC